MTPHLSIPAPGFHKNPGAYPDQIPPGTKLRVQFGNGCIDEKHTYEPHQLRWNLTGHDWDVGAVALANVDVPLSGARPENGSYE